jgi:hypothetical protein
MRTIFERPILFFVRLDSNANWYKYKVVEGRSDVAVLIHRLYKIYLYYYYAYTRIFSGL